MNYNGNRNYKTQWENWAIQGPDKEELFQEARQIVLETMNESLPQILEGYIANITLNVETRLNGQQSNLKGLRADAERLVFEELKKAFK